MKVFETDVYTMQIQNDALIEFRIRKNKTLDAADIWQSRDQSVEYMPGKKFVVLLEAEENFNATIAARRAGASEEYTRHVKAVAMFSQRMHESIMGSIYLKVSKPRVPTKFFDDRDKAIEWLRSQL